MKRSDMINFMAKTWRSYCKKMGPDKAGVGNACNHLLTEMEKVGILPPEIKQTDPGHFPGDSYTYWVNEWEPEDEENT